MFLKNKYKYTVNFQATLTGEHLSNVQFDRVYTSEYTRTKQTAQILLSQSKSAKYEEMEDKIIIDPLLHEFVCWNNNYFIEITWLLRMYNL